MPATDRFRHRSLTVAMIRRTSRSPPSSTHPATGATARIEWQGLGAYDFTERNTLGQNAYQLLNLRLGWQGAHFGIAAFGQNLTDETYFSFPIPGGPGGDFVVAPGAPRTVGVTASARF